MAKQGDMARMTKNWQRNEKRNHAIQRTRAYSIAIKGGDSSPQFPVSDNLLNAVRESICPTVPGVSPMCGRQIFEDFDALGIEPSKVVQNYLLAHWS